MRWNERESSSLREAALPEVRLQEAVPRVVEVRLQAAVVQAALRTVEVLLPAARTAALRIAEAPVRLRAAAMMTMMMTVALREAVALLPEVRLQEAALPPEARLVMPSHRLRPVLQDRFPMYMAVTA